MGRKQKLKVQRRIEEKNEFTTKKEGRKKLILNIIFLVLMGFAVWQVGIALNKNKNAENESSIIKNSNEITDDIKIEDDSTRDSDAQNQENNAMADVVDDEEPKEELEVAAEEAEDRDIEQNQENRIAIIQTNRGSITLELYSNDAPKTVENFVKLANENFYDGIKFHRVISNFMIQTGDPLSKDDDPANDGTGGPGYSFGDEINYHKIEVGSLAMANSGPNTNGSQFFIVTERAQPHLDGKHTVFGKVLEGMDVVTSIEQGDVMNKVYIK